MNTEQILKAYIDKKDVSCPITNRLIMAGYQQEREGYIKYAHELGVEVDYRKALPTQWWHLIKSYCERSESKKLFGKSIVCGELIFWMAEALECVDVNKLNALADEIIKSAIPKKRRDNNKPPVIYDRKKWNAVIQELCFDKIVEKVENMK